MSADHDKADIQGEHSHSSETADNASKYGDLDGRSRTMPKHVGGRIRTAADRTRTDDLRFTKPLLYQLSYGGAVRFDSIQCTTSP